MSEAIQPPRAPPPVHGLDAIATLELNETNRQRLDRATANLGGGNAVWRRRKQRDAHDLLALQQISPAGRMELLELDLRESLRAMIRLRVPVACRAGNTDDVIIAPGAILTLSYAQEALFRPQPGFSFIEVLFPPRVWHPSVSNGPGPIQAMCLGSSMPAGIKCVELVLLAFGALQMILVQVDEMDPAGVMNGEAARYWQARMADLPLSRTPFLMPE